jgi:hypothetical protein
MGPGGPRFSAGPALFNATKSNQQCGAFNWQFEKGVGGGVLGNASAIGGPSPEALRHVTEKPRTTEQIASSGV